MYNRFTAPLVHVEEIVILGKGNQTGVPTTGIVTLEKGNQRAVNTRERERDDCGKMKGGTGSREEKGF